MHTYKNEYIFTCADYMHSLSVKSVAMGRFGFRRGQSMSGEVLSCNIDRTHCQLCGDRIRRLAAAVCGWNCGMQTTDAKSA
eukprot:scaffold14967_cov17-Prasinocladus_malaysianus.AAC.2